MTGRSKSRVWIVVALLLMVAGAAISLRWKRRAVVATVASATSGVTRDFEGREKQWVHVALGDVMHIGDAVRTAASARAVLALQSDATIVLDSDTVLRFLERAPKRGQFRVEAGRATLQTGDEGVELETALGVFRLSARTAARLEHGTTGSRLRVDMGTASLIDPGTTPQALSPGDELFLEPNLPPRVEREAPAEQDAGGQVASPTPLLASTSGIDTGLGEEELENPETARGATGDGPQPHLPVQPSHADVSVRAGERATVHDAGLATNVRLRYEHVCPSGEGVVDVASPAGRFGARAASTQSAVIRLAPGTLRYRVRCPQQPTGALHVVATGEVRVVRDAAVRGVPMRPPTNEVDLDGRRYTVLYQNRLPVVVARAARVGQTGRVVVRSRARMRTVDAPLGVATFASGDLADGVHSLVFESLDGRVRTAVTTLSISFDNAAPMASIDQRGSVTPEGDGQVQLSGVVPLGARVSLAGEPLALDAGGRFAATTRPAEGDSSVSLRVEHPHAGLHYYVRRIEDRGGAVSDRHEDSVGRIILGRYRVLLPLGRGGQGSVYLARGEGAEGFARPVVVKRILAPLARDPVVLEQFAREARITAQLRHPAIVPIIDFARDRDSHVMVLEYVHGYDLRRWERYVRKVRGHFPAELVVYPMLRVLDALQYAHTLRGADGTPRSVIHRDISPANVLIDVEGHVKLTDFGIARMADEEMTQDTSSVTIKGKLPYLAPEMFLGERASERTDLYACGVVLHELLGGRNVFFAPSAVESMARVTGHIPARLDKIRNDLPEVLSDIVERALAKDPNERFQSAHEFSTVLRAAFDIDENQMAERFRSVIFRDFHDPQLAEITSSRTLSDLDATWRTGRHGSVLGESVRSAPLETTQAESNPAPPTVADRAPSGERPTVDRTQRTERVAVVSDPPSRSRLPGAALGLVGMIAVAALAFALVRAQRSDGPRFVYVDRQPAVDPLPVASPAPAAPSNVEAPASEPKAPAPASTLTATSPSRVRSRITASHEERLTLAFSRQRARVEACFSKHQAELEGRTTLFVQFTVDTGGRVRSASLVPDDLTRTPFGSCVTRIAGATTFGPQEAPLAFRIPITARTLTVRP